MSIPRGDVDAPEVEIAVGPVQGRVAPRDGGRLTSVTVGGGEILAGVGIGSIEYGWFVMSPWAGRIRSGVLMCRDQMHRLPVHSVARHGGHDLVVDQPWQLGRRDDDRVRMPTGLGGA